MNFNTITFGPPTRQTERIFVLLNVLLKINLFLQVQGHSDPILCFTCGGGNNTSEPEQKDVNNWVMTISCI